MAKVKTQRKMKVAQEAFLTKYNQEYKRWLNIPEELVPTDENIGEIVEVAGSNEKKEQFKIYSINKEQNHITLIHL